MNKVGTYTYLNQYLFKNNNKWLQEELNITLLVFQTVHM